jgi:hypothetical protein
VAEALEIDRLVGTDLWTWAINKEMAKVKVAWEARDDLTPEVVRAGKARDMIGFQEIGCHIIFDIKMDFTRKARFVAGGHMTNTPAAMTYSSVVSRESVRLGFLNAALNGLHIMSCDLENAYLNAKCKEKIWFEGGIECGADQGKVLIVVRALYGLKSAGASWSATLAQALRDLGFVSTTADPDVWIRAMVCDHGFEYYGTPDSKDLIVCISACSLLRPVPSPIFTGSHSSPVSIIIGKLRVSQSVGTRVSKYTIIPVVLKGMKASLTSMPNCCFEKGSSYTGSPYS